MLDIYCYVCNDSKRDPELPVHLASFGINVQGLSKTEKSMTELVSYFRVLLKKKSQSLIKEKKKQIEHNLKYDFSLTGDDGKALEPVFGPGLTGLANLGNRQIILFCFFFLSERDSCLHYQLLHGFGTSNHFLSSSL